jgi:hypothetical protein
MTAAIELLTCCRSLGIDLAPGPGGTLAWEADTAPPADLLADLRRHKADVLALLTPQVAADADFICRAIEADLHLPPGSVFLDAGDSCPGCDYCRPRGNDGQA